MSQSQEEFAPETGDRGPGVMQEAGGVVRRGVQGYLIGLALAVLLTVLSFLVAPTHAIYMPAVPVALVVLAIAQIGVHLVFFLHVTTAPDNTNNVLALAFGVLIVVLIVGGSLWIMHHLDQNMAPMYNMNLLHP